jgi:ubiquinone biosynthesis protein Coq4
MNTIITTGFVSSFTEGDVMEIVIENSLGKIFWHWLLRKKLRRYNRYKITVVNQTTLKVE